MTGESASFRPVFYCLFFRGGGGFFKAFNNFINQSTPYQPTIHPSNRLCSIEHTLPYTPPTNQPTINPQYTQPTLQPTLHSINPTFNLHFRYLPSPNSNSTPVNAHSQAPLPNPAPSPPLLPPTIPNNTTPLFPKHHRRQPPTIPNPTQPTLSVLDQPSTHA